MCSPQPLNHVQIELYGKMIIFSVNSGKKKFISAAAKFTKPSSQCRENKRDIGKLSKSIQLYFGPGNSKPSFDPWAKVWNVQRCQMHKCTCSSHEKYISLALYNIEVFFFFFLNCLLKLSTDFFFGFVFIFQSCAVVPSDVAFDYWKWLN